MEWQLLAMTIQVFLSHDQIKAMRDLMTHHHEWLQRLDPLSFVSNDLKNPAQALIRPLKSANDSLNGTSIIVSST